MSRYKKDPGTIYKNLRESIEEEPVLDTGVDMNSETLAQNFKSEFEDELIEILREIAKVDQANFDQNRDRLLADLEKVLRDPTINNVNARILVSKNEDEDLIYNES